MRDFWAVRAGKQGREFAWVASAMNPGPIQREVARFDEPRSRDAAFTYEPFYRLAQKPFSLAADPHFLFRSSTRGPVFDDLLEGIRRREGLVVLTSDIGMGKTTLCRAAIQQLDRKTFSAFVPDPFMTREDLLKTLLMDFGVVSIDELRGGHLRAASRLELSYVLYEFLDSLVPLQAFAVVFIDEAQNLSIPLLEEVRILSDLVGREKLLQVVLVGQLELDAKLKLPEMRQVDHRVAMRCSLTPLTDDEVGRYVKHRLSVAGTPATTVAFTGDALDEVCRFSQGVPRVINLLCDRALYESFRLREDQVTRPSVLKAAERLGLTPAASPNEAVAVPANPTPAPPAPRHTSPPPPPAVLIAAAGNTLSEFRSETDLPATADRVQTGSVDRDPSSRSMRAGTAIALLTMVAMISGGLSWYFLNQLGGSLDIQPPAAPPAPRVRAAQAAVPVQPPSEFDSARAPEPPLHRQSSEEAGGPAYGIQIASFESEDRAAQLAQLLAAAGIPARVIERDRGEAGRWHQVLADGYTSFATAEADLLRVRNMKGYADARLFRIETGLR
jgi:type II secretory pathway predicted ATPase ExeA